MRIAADPSGLLLGRARRRCFRSGPALPCPCNHPLPAHPARLRSCSQAHAPERKRGKGAQGEDAGKRCSSTLAGDRSRARPQTARI